MYDEINLFDKTLHQHDFVPCKQYKFLRFNVFILVMTNLTLPALNFAVNKASVRRIRFRIPRAQPLVHYNDSVAADNIRISSVKNAFIVEFLGRWPLNFN